MESSWWHLTGRNSNAANRTDNQCEKPNADQGRPRGDQEGDQQLVPAFEPLHEGASPKMRPATLQSPSASTS